MNNTLKQEIVFYTKLMSPPLVSAVFNVLNIMRSLQNHKSSVIRLTVFHFTEWTITKSTNFIY